MTGHPDPRLNAYRPDLADARLRGRVEAGRFVDGQPRTVVVPVAEIRRNPSPDSSLDTQFLAGDRLEVFEEAEGWAWVKGERDGYVGYAPARALAPVEQTAEGVPHRVCVPRTFLYPEPDMKRPALDTLPMGACAGIVETVAHGTMRFVRLGSGAFGFAGHFRPADEHAPDYVAVAERLLHTPYLWGGTSGFGLDCSGLVQLAMLMAGERVVRDTYMQEAAIGTPIDRANRLARGDLVFWDGHVGIMRDGETLLHANAGTMDVTSEPLAQALERIGAVYGPPTAFRRP
ncbi:MULTISPECIES: NlpC/P60 family protein [unclassified Roseitalea]|uniref:NlpC/P60 family protein n=1 Tax=unclassified Roseitalea TaxID=2639107 RepID=UPI00273D885D|nr:MULTISPECIES: NlpC/P60 family protein [unclassified Roseitalea]